MGTSVKGIQVATSFEKAATLVQKPTQISSKVLTEASTAAKATAKALQEDQIVRAAIDAAKEARPAGQQGGKILGAAQTSSTAATEAKVAKAAENLTETVTTAQKGKAVVQTEQAASTAATEAKVAKAAENLTETVTTAQKGKAVVQTEQAASEMVTGERVGEVAAQVMNPNIGRKLDFVFGKATGRRHNLHRSTDMQRQLNKIGIFDNDSSRAYLCRHLAETLNNPNNITLSKGGCITKESLLMGPNGGLKMESVWIGADLISIKLMG